MHRIVEIRQDDEYLDRVLFTRGDNNNPNSFDPRPTFESGYVGVVIWTANYIWPAVPVDVWIQGLAPADRSSRGAWNRADGVVDERTKVIETHETVQPTSVSRS